MCENNSEQGWVGTGYEACIVSGEWVCVNNVYTVCSSGGSYPTTLNPKKDPEAIVAQRSVCGCERVQPTISSLRAGPKEKEGLNMTKVKGQSRAATGAKEGLSLELKNGLERQPSFHILRLNVNGGCFQ